MHESKGVQSVKSKIHLWSFGRGCNNNSHRGHQLSSDGLVEQLHGSMRNPFSNESITSLHGVVISKVLKIGNWSWWNSHIRICHLTWQWKIHVPNGYGCHYGRLSEGDLDELMQPSRPNKKHGKIGCAAVPYHRTVGSSRVASLYICIHLY